MLQLNTKANQAADSTVNTHLDSLFNHSPMPIEKLSSTELLNEQISNATEYIVEIASILIVPESLNLHIPIFALSCIIFGLAYRDYKKQHSGKK